MLSVKRRRDLVYFRSFLMVRGCDDNSRESGNPWTPLQQILPTLWVPATVTPRGDEA
jgi:hypothetical protein